MGIKNLKSIIKKNAPEALTEINLNQIVNSRVCIDSSILLYQFRYSCPDDNFHIVGFLNKTIELLKIGIIPIFVFDGKPPDAKSFVLTKRAELRNKSKERLIELNIIKNNLENQLNINVEEYINDSDLPENGDYVLLRTTIKEIEKINKNTLYVNKNHSMEVIELLKSIGIPFFESIGEAEESCAFLQKNGFADYILTEDTDSLTFGGSNIIFRSKTGSELCKLPKVLEGLKLEYHEFIDLCILCGCDYTCSIPKIGPVNALNIIKKFRSIENFIQNNNIYIIPVDFDFLTARKLFIQNINFELPTVEFNFGQMDTALLSRILLKYHINIELINNLINLK
jgi:flap endonuclease-1